MITTAASDPAARNCFRVSSPSIPGNHTSRRTQPYARRSSAFRHSSPVATASAAKPSSSITPRNVSRMPRSSSTMRIESDMKNQEAGAGGSRQKTFVVLIMYCLLLSPRSCAACLLLLPPAPCLLLPPPALRVNRRHLDYEPRAARIICFRANPAAMFQDDPLHDGQPQTCARTAGREIRLKESSKIRWWNAVTSVCHFGNQPTAFVVMQSRNRD